MKALPFEKLKKTQWQHSDAYDYCRIIDVGELLAC